MLPPVTLKSTLKIKRISYAKGPKTFINCNLMSHQHFQSCPTNFEKWHTDFSTELYYNQNPEDGEKDLSVYVYTKLTRICVTTFKDVCLSRYISHQPFFQKDSFPLSPFWLYQGVDDT